MAMNYLLAICLFLSPLCFALGISQPLIQVDRLWLLSAQSSLVSIIATLWQDDDWPLAIIVFVFSILAPAAKLLFLQITALRGSQTNIHGWFRALSNWSMLDVILVALIIFAAKTSGLAQATTKIGLWFFALSVLLTAISSWLLKHRPRGNA